MKPGNVSVAMALLCCGCAGVSSWELHDVDDDLQFSDDASYGLIVVSTRFPAEWAESDSSPEFLLVYDDDYGQASRGGLIPGMGRGGDRDFESPPGHLTVRKALPGKHFIQPAVEYHGERVVGPSGLPIHGLGGRGFLVEAGRITYLGEFSFSTDRCWGGNPCARVTNQWARDRRLLFKKMKNLRLEGERAGRPLVEDTATAVPAAHVKPRP
ncbi:hypothetical protein ACN47A_24445 [Myxococcus fulvus]|uniref:hypothetical protein n=1 Tax=Myxococcus fulvus TaxID=33 RepID=UPI003B9B20C4